MLRFTRQNKLTNTKTGRVVNWTQKKIKEVEISAVTTIKRMASITTVGLKRQFASLSEFKGMLTNEPRSY